MTDKQIRKTRIHCGIEPALKNSEIHNDKIKGSDEQSRRAVMDPGQGQALLVILIQQNRTNEQVNWQELITNINSLEVSNSTKNT